MMLHPNLKWDLCVARTTDNLNIASELLVGEFETQSFKKQLWRSEQKALGIGKWL